MDALSHFYFYIKCMHVHISNSVEWTQLTYEYGGYNGSDLLLGVINLFLSCLSFSDKYSHIYTHTHNSQVSLISTSTS